MVNAKQLRLLVVFGCLGLVGVVFAEVSDLSPVVQLKAEYSFNKGEAHSLKDLGIGTANKQIQSFLQVYHQGSMGFSDQPEPKFIRPDHGIKSSENDKTTYGATLDHREFYQIPTDEGRVNAQSVASISDRSERTIPARGFCSAFLVGLDMALTSSHCVNNKDFSTKVLRFGDQYAAAGIPPSALDSYEILSVDVWDFRYDLALVKLKANSQGVLPGKIYQPLSISRDARPVGTNLYLIGHAAGEYKKYVDNCTIRVDVYRHATGKKTFGCDCDAFGGMSGSPVFDAVTHKVIGILWGGQRDIRTIPVADKQNHEYVVPMWQAASVSSFDHGRWPPTIEFALKVINKPPTVGFLDLPVE